MSFHTTESGRCYFISADSRAIPENPLYKAFKNKSLTGYDIALHFHILDALADKKEHFLRDIADCIAGRCQARRPGLQEPYAPCKIQQDSAWNAASPAALGRHAPCGDIKEHERPACPVLLAGNANPAGQQEVTNETCSLYLQWKGTGRHR